jgi:ABC-type antimicrobial peptide transport system permease subunit
VHTLDGAPWRQVIGVVVDTRDNGVDQASPATVYWPSYGEGLYAPGTTSIAAAVTFTIRSERAGTAALVDDLRRAVWSVSRSLPVSSVRTLNDIYVESMARASFAMTLLTAAAGIGLVLGLVGIYGLVAYGVAQRTREIGIRLALGAGEGTVKVIFMRRALALTAAGVAASFALTRLMGALLFETSPLDPVTYAVAPVVLAVAAAIASYVPARRAAAVDPVEALRAE